MISLNLIELTIKKLNPKANFKYADNNFLYYNTKIKVSSGDEVDFKLVTFAIPLAEIGDNIFHPKMDSLILLKWLSVK